MVIDVYMKENSLNILNKLVSQGYQAYIVGGYVRDLLIGKNTLDVDICTNAKPKDIQKIFKDAKISSFEYGSICLKNKNIDYEITTFRKEIKYENNRKPVEIEYIDDLKEDLLRRDFTINTLCMNKDENIIDLLNGKEDIEKCLIKTVGDPDKKIKEDSLRILRAVRFATVLNFKIDKSLRKSISKNKNLLLSLSYERKKDELNRIFMSENKKYGIKLLKELNLIKPLCLKNIDKALLTNDLLGIWAVIDEGDKYQFTKGEKSIITSIRESLKEKKPNNISLYKYGSYVISVMCDLRKLNKKEYMERYDKLQIQNIKNIKISASDVCSLLGREPGAFLKDIFKDLEYKIVMDKLANEQKEIEKYLIDRYIK